MYQTPSSHRIIIKRIETVAGKDTLVSSEDNSIVTVRPKAYVDSSGTTWASESVRYRIQYPQIFEVPTSDTDHPIYVRQYCAAVYCSCFQYTDMTVDSDVEKLSNDPDAVYKNYEGKRVEHLVKKLMEASTFKQPWPENSSNILNLLELKVDEVIAFATSKEQLSADDIQRVSDMCRATLTYMKSLNLNPVCPRIAEMTDAGPGVGISNMEVRFRDAELARMNSSDYRIRAHRAHDDSGHNEAERTNSAIGDAVVDGKTIHWEKRRRFEGMTEAEIAALDIKGYEKLEAERMELNCWDVTKVITNRIDGAPVLGGFIHSHTSQHEKDLFFFNKAELKRYCEAPKTQKEHIPGAGYFQKIYMFISQHYEVGEMYIEYVKMSCQTNGDKCSFCQDSPWHGPPIARMPKPKPDVSKLPDYQYLPLQSTPSMNEDGTERDIDDFAPRPNLKKLFENDSISVDDEEAICSFSEKFITKKEFVVAYVEHMTNLRRLKRMRQTERDKERSERDGKGYEDYDWEDEVNSGHLKQLTVAELNKYLQYHELSLQGNKRDKFRRIIAHVCQNLDQDLGDHVDMVDGDGEIIENEELEDVMEEEMVLGEVRGDDDSEEESDDDSEDDSKDTEEEEAPHVEIPQRSRYSGRKITRKTYDDYV